MNRLGIALVLSAVVVGVIAAPSQSDQPVKASATCSDYDNQREAQLRKDTRDADGDGIHCESLPCPCRKSGEPPPRKKKPEQKPSRLKSKRTFVTDYGRIGNLRYKPRTIWYVMDSRIWNIRWASWRAEEAKGAGTIEWEYCDSNCPEDSYKLDYEVTITLSRRKVCRRYRRYTRLRWDFVDAKPEPTNPFERVFTTQRMVCPR